MTRRTSTTVFGPPSEAWNDGGEGSIVVRFRHQAVAGRSRAASVASGEYGEDNRIPEGEIGIAPVSGHPLWTSVGQVATLTLCAAC
ncbi:hypothetical protein GCM10010357_59950 [Streptomyces luteireticuli]|uniref:Uncharacterized protein n=1 Tax=Streptomyces luteireticuli TaxID=173858 RepID=A0ABN0Z2M1_9ACTN